MKNVVLEEKISNIINEELGIANEVINLTNLIEKKLTSFITSEVYEKEFSVKTELSDLNVNYVMKNFDNETDANMWIAYERGNDGYSYRDNTIYLSIVSINGDIDYVTLSDTIQHECTHYWEMKNMHRDLYNSDYQDVINGIRNKNPYVSLTYSVIYYSNKNEINAFVSGSFASAMKKRTPYKNYKEFINDNSVGEIYSELSDALTTISNIDVDEDVLFDSAAMRIGCDKYYLAEFIKNAANVGLNYLIKRVGKAYALYMERLKETNN